MDAGPLALWIAPDVEGTPHSNRSGRSRLR
jgi:hypothetical protein